MIGVGVRVRVRVRLVFCSLGFRFTEHIHVRVRVRFGPDYSSRSGIHHSDIIERPCALREEGPGWRSESGMRRVVKSGLGYSSFIDKWHRLRFAFGFGFGLGSYFATRITRSVLYMGGGT